MAGVDEVEEGGHDVENEGDDKMAQEESGEQEAADDADWE